MRARRNDFSLRPLTAHDLQMGLMPTEPPQIEGFDITGRCIPANHVGDDFFQYFQYCGKLSLYLADVTGHAIEAVLPVMMFSGVLNSGYLLYLASTMAKFCTL